MRARLDAMVHDTIEIKCINPACEDCGVVIEVEVRQEASTGAWVFAHWRAEVCRECGSQMVLDV